MVKKIRPKKYHTEVSRHPVLRRKWRKWLPSMIRDLTDMYGKQEIFWDLQEITKENASILSRGEFFDWMCRNYILAMTVSIRSFVDHSRDVHSLWRMLYEILEHPGVISRSSHVALYKGSSNGFDMANHTFNSVVGKSSKCLSQRAVKSDLKRIEDASDRVRKFVNKRIAHRTSLGELRRSPTFKDLDETLGVIDKIFCKYNRLLTASGLSSTKPVRQHNWMEVLWEPWIRNDSRFRP